VDQNDQDTFFKVGDIVVEGALLSTGVNSPLVGVVLQVEIDFFFFSEDYLSLQDVGKRIQDRILIYWFLEANTEKLPEDLLILVSRNDS
jgi:hypothetical protein